MLRLSYEEAVDRLAGCLQRSGLTAAEARPAAEMVLEGEVKKKIGLFMIRKALQEIRNRPPSLPRIVHQTAVSARIDGGRHLGEVCGPLALRVALEKAAGSGLAVVGMTDFLPFPLLASLTERAAAQGFAALAWSSTPAVAVPLNGRRKSLGTNPLAVSIPADAHVFTVDMATTNTLITQVRMAAEKAGLLPEGVAVDADGRPTQDARAALEGALTVFGGHRGSGLSLAVALLTGSLLGLKDSLESYSERGLLLVLLHPDLFGAGSYFPERAGRTLQFFRDRGGAEFRFPGEKSAQRLEEARRSGISIPPESEWLFMNPDSQPPAAGS